MTQQPLAQHFYGLTPEAVLNGVDEAGYTTTGFYLQLNSYENRVYEVWLEPEQNPAQEESRVIVKYYRPLRWSRSAIAEEHEFLFDLQHEDIPAVAPLVQSSGSTIGQYKRLYMTLFPKGLGRMPDELFMDDFRSIGRLLARIHNVGEKKSAHHRLSFDMATYGWPLLECLKEWVDPKLWPRYEKAAREIIGYLEDRLEPQRFIRIHGDCHHGNILIRDVRNEPLQYFFVDFDDFSMGPPAQDFWMLFSEAEGETLEAQKESLLEGYTELRDFKPREEALFVPLRGLRILRYAAWIAQRWEDPMFPQAFPGFGTFNYWEEETRRLEHIADSLETANS